MRKIKKTDTVIGNLKPDWINSRGQFVDRIYYSFEGTRNSSSQGLCLVVYKDTGSKKFTLRYWVGGRSKTYTLGQFIPGQYGIKEAQKDLIELRAKYGGANYTFEQDIKQQIKIEEEKELQQQLTTLTEKKVKDVILDWYKKGCPNIVRKGNVSRTQLMDLTNAMIGRHNRRKYFLIDEKPENSEGFIRVLDKKYKRVGKNKGYRIHKTGLSTFEDVMNKYPPEGNKDNKPERSIIDNAIADLWVKNLTFGKVQSYIQLHDTRNAQIQVQKALSYVWNEAKKSAALGESPGENPTHGQPITHKRNEAIVSERSKHVKKYLTQEQIDLVWKKLEEYRYVYKFQTHAAKFPLLAGLRLEEVLKIDCENIKYDDLTLYLDDAGTKLREESGVVITPLLFQVLKELEEDRRAIGLDFVGLAFPSVKIKTIEAKVKKHQYSFKRMKGCVRLFRALSKDLGFAVNASILKNTYHNTAAQKVDKDNDLIKLTRHKDPGVLHSNYISRKITKEVRDNANKVGEYFENIVQFKKKA